MRHQQYTNMGRELARRHVAIQHSPEQCRFLRILISSDPIQKQLDLNEFYTSLRNKLDLREGKAALILENYQADYGDNDGDFYAKYHHSSFLVLKLTEAGDFDGRDAVIDECEEIGEDLMGAIIAQLREAGLQISPDDVLQEAVGPIAQVMVGCRFNYVFRSAATQALTYKPSKFLD
ncbi:hypothetical protein [Hymenobacter psychrotolerans]|uniref:Uncharacterized protein n=1 Tax=Hymenobacter psychrotolerans DSM 18569 TaxID=1121959 RepID=A0A1M6Z673_9BACT|nr:hypothetical protein [Hymenobacter psychrotolerans]SHL25951.1 hypothetical protein SAMN02746009_02435 [Hymenobacter psychrotolerans DSM 18569]